MKKLPAAIAKVYQEGLLVAETLIEIGERLRFTGSLVELVHKILRCPYPRARKIANQLILKYKLVCPIAFSEVFKEMAEIAHPETAVDKGHPYYWVSKPEEVKIVASKVKKSRVPALRVDEWADTAMLSLFAIAEPDGRIPPPVYITLAERLSITYTQARRVVGELIAENLVEKRGDGRHAPFYLVALAKRSKGSVELTVLTDEELTELLVQKIVKAQEDIDSHRESISHHELAISELRKQIEEIERDREAIARVRGIRAKFLGK